MDSNSMEEEEEEKEEEDLGECVWDGTGLDVVGGRNDITALVEQCGSLTMDTCESPIYRCVWSSFSADGSVPGKWPNSKSNSNSKSKSRSRSGSSSGNKGGGSSSRSSSSKSSTSRLSASAERE